MSMLPNAGRILPALPPLAAVKLEALRRAHETAVGAKTAAIEAHWEARQHTAQMSPPPAGAMIQKSDEEKSPRLKNALARLERARAHEAAAHGAERAAFGVLERVLDWLSERRFATLVDREPVVLADEELASPVAALARARQEVSERQQEQQRLRAAAPSREEVREQVAGIARGLRCSFVALDPQRRTMTLSPAPGVDDIKKFLLAIECARDPVAFEKMLLAQAEASLSGSERLSRGDCDAALAACAEKIEELERREEALVGECRMRGADVHRRINADPAAILGVTLATAAVAPPPVAVASAAAA
jgi:hypothetical protein